MKKFLTLFALILTVSATAQTYEIKGHKDFHAKNEKSNGLNHITFRNQDYANQLVTDEFTLTDKEANEFISALLKYHAPNESIFLSAGEKTIQITYHADKGRHYRKIVVCSDNKRSQMPYFTDRQFKKLLGLN